MDRHLKPQHFSIVSRPSRSARPNGMEEIRVPNATREAIESVALGVFTNMVNAGRNFHEALSAIYLSGLQHGYAARKENGT